MFVRLIICLLFASSAYGAAYRDSLIDTTYVQDTYIADVTSTDSVTNYGRVSSMRVQEDAVGLIRLNNLRAAIGAGRAITACTLSIATNTLGGTAGYLGSYRVKANWGEGWLEGEGGYRRGGAAWRYRNMPSYPDTTPQANLPSQFCWQDSALDTDAKSQLPCGACYAFAATAAFETAAKIQNSSRLISYNTGNGTGADRNTYVYDTARVTGTGWVSFQVQPSIFKDAWDDATNQECGLAITLVGNGDFEVWTSEAADAANHPRFFVHYGVSNNGIGEDLTYQFKGTTATADVLLYGDADSTTNHGADSTAHLTSTNKVLLIKANGIRTALGDSVVYIGSDLTGGIVCSLRVKTKTADGRINHNKSFKKWVEGEATARLWKSGSAWGSFQSGTTNELDASEQELMDCAPTMGCNGGSCRAALEWWRLNDVYSEEQIPFTAEDDDDCDTSGLSADYSRLKWWWPIDRSTKNKLKQAVLIRPVAASIDYASTGAPISFDNIDEGDCFYRTGASSGKSHAILIIGWDDDFVCGDADSTGAWIIRNSYGELWGENGRAYISYRYAPLIRFQGYSGTSETYVIAETQQDPLLWGNPGDPNVGGMIRGTDYDSNYFALTQVTADAETRYYIPIPADIVQAWYDNNEVSFGICLRQERYANTHLDQRFVASEATHPTLTGLKPYFIIRSTDRVTKIGAAKIGNAKIGN